MISISGARHGESVTGGLKFRIDDPHHDIAEFALGADLPVFGVADGAFPAAAGLGDEGFVLAVGLAGERDGAGDVGAGRRKQKQQQEDQVARRTPREVGIEQTSSDKVPVATECEATRWTAQLFLVGGIGAVRGDPSRSAW